MSGYDQFFKEAGKASGLRTGKPVKSAAKLSKQAGKASSSKPKFKLQSNANEEQPPKSRDRIRIGTPEEQLRKEIARRSKEKKSASMRKRQAFPVFPAIIAVVALVSSGVGYFQPELMDQALARVSNISGIEISMFGSANAAADLDHGKGAKKAAKTDAKAKDSAKAESAKPGEAAAAAHGEPAGVAAAVAGAAGETPVAETKPSDIRSWSDEELSFFNKLNDRKKELDLREAELAKLEEELSKQKTDLDEKLKQLEAMRADISKTLKTRVAVDQEKVDKLVQTYSTMKAQNAAKIIETLNEDLAVEVMDKMKKKNAAEIMNMMDAKKARRLSELLTGYQRSPANAGADGEAASGETENATN